jgi:hypothetical protein
MIGMDNKLKYTLGLSWWNTGLSPNGMPNTDNEKRKVATNIISFLIKEYIIDCLAIGEVTTEDLRYIYDNSNLANYSFFDGAHKKGRLTFETGIIYNKQRLEKLEVSDVIFSNEIQSLKIAQKIDFNIYDTNERLRIYVSHWTSRAQDPNNKTKRDDISRDFRTTIDAFRKEYSSAYLSTPQIILIGDFNDEPYDNSLEHNLHATRDRTLVLKNDYYLYNPFWKHLGEIVPHSHNTKTDSISGTCFYKNDKDTHWRTFDQIIFSSSFLHDDRWYLEEKMTGVFQHAQFNEVFRSFDHRPVYSYISRNVGD